MCIIHKIVSFLLFPRFDFNKRMLTNGLRCDIMVTRKQYTVFLPSAMQAPTAAGEPCRKRLYLRVNGVDDPRMEQVKKLLAQHRGDLPVILFDAGTRKQYMAPRSLWTYNNLRLFDEIRFILGDENVIMKKVK